MIQYLWENLFKREQKERDVSTILKENYIFKDLSLPELHFVEHMVHIRTYRPGETIFKQGELGVGMYIVMKGTVNITVEDLATKEMEDAQHFVARLTRGDFFGEIALVEKNGRRTATATARDEVILIGFYKPDLNEIITRSPKTGVKITIKLGEILGKRLKETAEKFSELKKEIRQKNIRT